MPIYDFRCQDCGQEFSLTYKNLRSYEAATPACPNCQSTALSRVIKRVAIQKPGRDYSRMSSQDMLSVLESGDAKQVGDLYRQVGVDPAAGAALKDQSQTTSPPDKPARSDKKSQAD